MSLLFSQIRLKPEYIEARDKAVENFCSNPHWRRLYEEAPSLVCKLWVEQSFISSSDIINDESFLDRKQLEEMMTVEDWKHLMKFISGPFRGKCMKRIKEIQEKQLLVTDLIRGEKVKTMKNNGENVFENAKQERIKTLQRCGQCGCSEYKDEGKWRVCLNCGDKRWKPEPHMCPVCGKFEFPEKDSYLYCGYCGWEDEQLAVDYPDEWGGANGFSFNEFKYIHEEFEKGRDQFEVEEEVVKMRETKRLKKINDAIIFAVEAHEGQLRKGTDIPYIVHPLEAVAIAATLTTDEDILAGTVLHDVVEDTKYTIKDIEDRFGKRVAEFVAAESEDKQEDKPAESTWKERKQRTIDHLANLDHDEKIICLADKLSNMRAIKRDFDRLGDRFWERFNQKDPEMQMWYYGGIKDALKELSGTPAYKEFCQLIEGVKAKIR